MQIDKQSPIPVYFQLRNLILDKINSGEYTKGGLIPSERELSILLGISRMTVRQALNQLVSEGVLFREKGRGTFVSKTRLEQRNVMSFSDAVRQKGLTPSTRILFFGKEKPAEDIRFRLDLTGNDWVFHVKRLRLADEKPVGIEEVFIPEACCPGLEQQDLTRSLYRLMKEVYHLPICYVDNLIEASKPRGEEKDFLQTAGSTVLLRIEGVSHTDTGLKLLYERSAYRSDLYRYNVRFYVSEDME